MLRRFASHPVTQSGVLLVEEESGAPLRGMDIILNLSNIKKPTGHIIAIVMYYLPVMEHTLH